MLIEQKTLKQLIKNKSNVDVNKVKDILQLDPTLKVDNIDDDTEIGKYGEWLLGKLYKKYNQLSDSDKDMIKSDLQFYDYQIRSKRIPSEYDNIYKIKSIKELNDIIIKLQDNNNPLTQDPVTVAIGNHKFYTVSENPFELLKRQYYGEIKEGGVTKWLVFNPKTKEESIVAGHNTSWCTARDDNKNQWDTYIYEGNTAWIFILSGKYKDANPDEYKQLIDSKLDKICIIVERGQCQTRNNNLFQLKLLPEIGDFIENKIDDGTIKLANYDILDYKRGIKQILTGIKNKNNRLYHAIKLTNLTKEKQIEQFKNRPNNYYKIIDEVINNDIEIDKDIQLQQVSQNGLQIEQIIQAGIKPDHDVQLQQVSQNGWQIRNVYNPTEDIQMQQVSQNGLQIEYIKNPSEDIQKQQVSQNGLQIEHIIIAGVQPENKNEWKNIQLQQVSQNGYQIKYIENPNEEVQLQQINQNPDQYDYIENPTPKQTQLYKQLTGVTESTQYISKLLDVN